LTFVLDLNKQNQGQKFLLVAKEKKDASNALAELSSSKLHQETKCRVTVVLFAPPTTD
jgi:hypothetical protein